MKKNDPLISYLLEENILSESALSKLVTSCESSGKSLVAALRSENLVTKDQMTWAIAVSNSIEFVTLSPDMIDQIAVRLVPYDMARQYDLIPVRIEKNNLYVAMSSPMNLSVRDTIEAKSGYKVVPLAATAEAIKQCVAYYFNVESVTRQDIVAMRLKHSPNNEIRIKKSQGSKVADAPIVRLVDSLITGAIESRASDIHIEPHEPDMRVRYRVDGILVEAVKVPLGAQLEVISHIKILAEMDISERRMPQDGHIHYEHNDKGYDLRVSSLPATGGEKIVIRILDATSGLKSLENIVNSDADLEKFQRLIANPYGMILLTGPTGSGKTTTLYSLIQALNKPDKNIVTIENPVEYRLNGITQIQTKADIGMTFASGLRSILRQDPDIILVGEIRDYETAEIAVSAALTGHLVLSTLHSNDAVGAVSRLISLGIPHFQIATSLLGTVAQRLIRTICPKCKTSYQPEPREVELTSTELQQVDDLLLYRGTGCDMCRQTGYLGRQGIYEIFEMSPDLRAMLINEASDDALKDQAASEGMRPLKAQGISQIKRGITTIEELYRVVDMRVY